MKKLFALFMAVAMLSAAGTAMAEVRVTANPGSVTVQAGTTATATLAVSGGDHARGTAVYTPSVSWASVSGNTITFAPGASMTAGTRNITVDVVETYESDVAGHGVATTLRDTGSVTIPVTITASTSTGGNTQANTVTKVVIITTTVVKQETITRATRTESIVSAAVQTSVSITTFAEVVKPVAQQVTSAVSSLVTALLSGSSSAPSTSATTALANILNTWTSATKTAEVQARAEASINTVEKRTALFPAYSGARAELTVPQENDQLQPAVSSTADNASTADKLVGASQKLGAGQKALSAGDAVTPKKSGTYKFPQVFGPKLYKTPIKGNRGIQGSGAGASFAASDANDDGIAFVDSAGNPTTVIPDDSDPDNVMPGYVNMMVVMEAGEVYEPVIYTTDTDLTQAIAENTTYADSADAVAVEATAEVVDTDTIEYESEKQKVTVEVDENGNETQIGEAEDIVEADTTVTSTMAAAMGATSITNALLVEGVEFPNYDATDNTNYANVNNYFIAGDVPAITGLPDGTYYVETTIGTLPAGRTLANGAAFRFYPNGFEAGAAAAKVFNADGQDTVDYTSRPAELLGQKAYLAFTVANNQISAAFDMGAPVLAVALQARESGNGGGGNNEEPVIQGVGSSSGGCSAGFAGLALAVLGSFVLTRKK